MRHAVIMAGGVGQRLWPLSRAARPKQLLKIAGGKSLLRESYLRLAHFLPPESIYVISSSQYLDLVAAELPELPLGNLFGEPVGRDTANAVGLAAAILKQRDPDATMGIFTADHVITPIEQFAEAVQSAFDMADQHADALVTMGINPTAPNTGFGYVQRGTSITAGVYEVQRFAEKPDRKTAEQYLASGDYYWNSGMFCWRVDTILAQLDDHLSEGFKGVTEIAASWEGADRESKLTKIYPTLPKISIDFAVMEKAPRVLVVEMNCDWVDLGNWTALEAVVDPDQDQNRCQAARAVTLGAKDNIIVCEDDHLIAAYGVDDLIIVRSADATLICRKSDAQNLKELVARVNERFGDQYA